MLKVIYPGHSLSSILFFLGACRLESVISRKHDGFQVSTEKLNKIVSLDSSRQHALPMWNLTEEIHGDRI